MRRHRLHTVYVLTVSLVMLSTAQRQAENWEQEALGESSSNDILTSLPEHERLQYKDKLLRYVFHTRAPTEEQLNPSASEHRQLPYVMERLYSLLANDSTGQALDYVPISVDYIRGLHDHWVTTRRMQFWFNTSAINETEDIIDAYFHIYKRRAIRPPGERTHHRVMVSLYKIVDEDTMYNPNGTIGAGAVKLQQHQVSAYSNEWIVFNVSLRDTVKDWVRNPASNKGFLLSAMDTAENHINGTHIDFVQRGEHPEKKQPIFAVYTDQVRRKRERVKRRERSNIDFLVENYLNENHAREETVERECTTNINSQESVEQCRMVIRRRRSLIQPSAETIENTQFPGDESSSDEDGYEDSWEDDVPRNRRRVSPQTENRANSYANNYCQKKPLYIKFEALGWEKWIVAPAGINAGYCDGVCPFPLTSAYTSSNHAVLQSVSNFYQPNDVKPPCCVPQKLARTSILYYDDGGVTMKSYANMIVESCGCR